jgi:quercetin dioxygenase-like cupin family protein
MSTVHLPAGQGQCYSMVDGDHIAKAAIRDDEGAFEVFEVLAPAAPMAPPHISPWTGVLYLLEGRVTAVVGGTTYEVLPGGVVVFPAGTPSSFEVTEDSARFVAITSGDRAGRFFKDFAASVPLDQPVPESMGTILAVTRRHGVTLEHTQSQE